MSERGRSLAARFEQANDELIAAVEQMSDDEWRKTTAAEGWTVGVIAHHVAEAHRALAQLVRRIAAGDPVALDMDSIHRANAEHARQHADCTRAETVALLRRNGAGAAATVQGLTDAELDRVGGRGMMTAAQVVERVLIGHVAQHLGSIRATLGPG
jgi:uncharacterized damage-inducible protein DinB